MATQTNPEPKYLGDGLYVEDHGHQLRLFCERGPGEIHEVYLDMYVLDSFLTYIKTNWNGSAGKRIG